MRIFWVVMWLLRTEHSPAANTSGLNDLVLSYFPEVFMCLHGFKVHQNKGKSFLLHIYEISDFLMLNFLEIWMVKKMTNKTKNMTGFQLAISLHLPLQTSYGQNFSDSVIGQLSFDTKFMANHSVAYVPQELVWSYRHWKLLESIHLWSIYCPQCWIIVQFTVVPVTEIHVISNITSKLVGIVLKLSKFLYFIAWILLFICGEAGNMTFARFMWTFFL